MGAAGTQTAALVLGGYPSPGHVTNSESYNGTSLDRYYRCKYC
jgi:hypothetical protein